MFSTPSIANKKRGSVGTLTTTNSSTLIPSNSLFGSQPGTSSTPSFGQQQQQPLTTGTNTLFNTPTSTTPSAPTNSLFGTKPTTPSLFGTSQPPATTTTPSLFGSTQPNNSLFQNTQNNNQQQQQQGKSYLDLDNCFPDTKVPHFVVTPNEITRTVVPANFFTGNDIRPSYSIDKNNCEPLSTSGFNERITALPHYLTSFDNINSTATNNKSSNNLSFKKRGLEEEQGTGSNTLLKTTTGVFSSKGTMPYGFDKNLTKEETQKPPTEQLNDVGLQSSSTQFGSFQRRFDTNTENELYRPLNNTSLLEPKKTRVRVFGYDQNNVEQIVKHFSNLGELSKPYICQGNWIIFDYVLHETALKAIACNGMNIDQDHLVGVTWDERAQEVEFLRYQRMNESADLYKNNNGFMNIFNHTESDLEKIHNNNNKEQKLFDKLREKLLGW